MTTALYVPGTGEKDLNKVIQSLQLVASKTATNIDNITTNTANIATNTANIAAWPGTTVGQLPFPATQVPSANVNTLDDYEEGTWTPAITFATPGDLSTAFSLIGGFYTKIGRQVGLSFAMVTSTFTYTTASGQCLITGLPFTPINDSSYRSYAPMLFQGINKASYTNVLSAVVFNSTTIQVLAAGMGQTVATVNAADMASGGTVILAGAVNYIV